MRARINERFPDDGIIGEEFGEAQGASGYRWILDPIDGTKSFICGVPLYGTMVGVEFRGDCRIGAVYCPGIDEGIYAMTGKGCWHQRRDQDPVKSRVSSCQNLNDAVMVTSEVRSFSDVGRYDLYRSLENNVYVSRTWGDCYGYLLVATGQVELMIDPELNIWDAAAVKPIVEESGGKFVDWNGNPRIDTGNAIGCCPGIYEEVHALVAQAGNS